MQVAFRGGPRVGILRLIGGQLLSQLQTRGAFGFQLLPLERV
jgi:hypothetical protein